LKKKNENIKYSIRCVESTETMRRYYTKEFKQEIVRLYENGTAAKQLYTEYDLPRSILYDWIKLYKKQADKNGNVFTYNELTLANKKISKLQQEIEILKKARCFPESPLKEKLNALESMHGQYPVKAMCRVLEVDHATFYNHHFRRVVKTQYEINDEFLKPKITEVFEKSKQRFGSRKIRAKLREQNIIASERKIRQLMQEMGLVPQRIKKQAYYPKINHNPYLRNKIQREFIQLHPNKVWVGDITSVWVDGNIYYLCVIIDLFSRKVIAAKVSYKNNTKLTRLTFKDAFESRGEPENVIFHSDRGTQYVSYEYSALLKSLRVDQSFSNTGNPYDNAVIEGFFSNMKKEELNRNKYYHFDDLKESVEEYVEFYNEYRPHETLGDIPPNKFEENYYASQ